MRYVVSSTASSPAVIQEHFKMGCMCIFEVEVVLVAPILPVRRDLLGPYGSSHISSCWSWTVTCPLTILSKVLFQWESDPFLIFLPFRGKLCSFLTPQNMCVFSVNEELPQLSRKVYLAFVWGGIISQILLHGVTLCACCLDVLLTLLLGYGSSSQHSWRVGFIGDTCSRRHPTAGKYFSVFNWPGLLDLIRDDKSCISVFLGSWKLFGKWLVEQASETQLQQIMIVLVFLLNELFLGV